MLLSFCVTYFTIKWDTPLSETERLGTTNSCYASSISSLSNKEPIYCVFSLNSEDVFISFWHVYTLCSVSSQFPQRRWAGWVSSWLLRLRVFFNYGAAIDATAATWATFLLYSIVLPCWICFCLCDFLLVITANCFLTSWMRVISRAF